MLASHLFSWTFRLMFFVGGRLAGRTGLLGLCENWQLCRIRARLQSCRERPSLRPALAAVGQGLKALAHEPLRSARLKACPDTELAVFTQTLLPIVAFAVAKNSSLTV
jgi:hypothetical protein